METDDVISFLSTLWSREGYCDELVSDNGPQFTSAKFEKYLSGRGIQHRKSSLYWPRGNAAVERFNRTLKTWLLEAAQQPSRTSQVFAAHVKRRLALYRAAPHCTTGMSPSESLHSRRMRLDLPVMSADSAPDADLRARVQTQQRRNARNYNRRRGVREPSIQPGDMVRVRRPGHTPKNMSRFGPAQKWSVAPAMQRSYCPTERDGTRLTWRLSRQPVRQRPLTATRLPPDSTCYRLWRISTSPRPRLSQPRRGARPHQRFNEALQAPRLQMDVNSPSQTRRARRSRRAARVKSCRRPHSVGVGSSHVSSQTRLRLVPLRPALVGVTLLSASYSI